MIPLVFAVSAIVSFLVTWLTIPLAKKMQLVTDPSRRKHPAHTHTGIIPRAGGIPVLAALLIASLVFIPINKIMIGILISSVLLVIIGLADDYRDTSPYIRFLGNLAISALVISFGLGIPFVSNPFGGVIRLDTWRISIDILGTHSLLVFADLIAVIWLAWSTNIINWSKGVDGQLPGFVAITAFFLGLLSQRFTAHDISAQTVMLLCFIISGAYLGFLPFNFYPQKIMPGYGGGALAGFLLGIIAILSFGKLGTAFLILTVPITDAIYTTLRRIGKGHSPFRADWGHFHHRLLEIGWGKRRIAVFYWLVSLILGFASLFLEGKEKFIAFLTAGMMLFVFMAIIEKVKKGNMPAKSSLGRATTP